MRRTRPSAKGARFDVRRTLRRSLRTRGEPFDRAWRDRRVRGRPLVLILDVSGSMSPYARALVQFGYAAMAAGRRVEVFCFGTRLTRVTRTLRTKDPDRALHEIGRTVADWEGGTRIGESLKSLLDGWSQRAALRGAVVVLCSDGLERGDPELLRAQMARLGRLAHKVVWVNPLKGSPRYEPLARGMAAALPSVDVFLSGHNLESLSELSPDPRRLTGDLRLLSFRTLLAMAADDDLIRAYDAELGPEPHPRRTGGSGSSPGRCWWAACSCSWRSSRTGRSRTRSGTRRTRCAGRRRPPRSSTAGRRRSREPDAEALADDVPDLAFRPADEASFGLDVVSVSASDHGVGRGGPGSAGSMLLHPPARSARTLATAPGPIAPARPRSSRTILAGSSRFARGDVEQFDRVDDVDRDAEHRAGPRGAASCSRGCRRQPRLPPVEATASAFSRIRRSDISGSVTL